MAAAALLFELETWPKPGLVSPVDRGSHADMDAGTFRASAEALRPFFAALSSAGNVEMDELRAGSQRQLDGTRSKQAGAEGSRGRVRRACRDR